MEPKTKSGGDRLFPCSAAVPAASSCGVPPPGKIRAPENSSPHARFAFKCNILTIKAHRSRWRLIVVVGVNHDFNLFNLYMNLRKSVRDSPRPPRLWVNSTPRTFFCVRLLTSNQLQNGDRQDACPTVQREQSAGSSASVPFTARRSSSGVNGLGRNRSGFTEKHHAR
jgi:hypothetical protein